ncbi:uncharacterized protein LOC122638731 [Telopea speciosissima]|uniref:uncharacterized protein LOC122638731 n=1 Tax=Telopea speciosissima TaxID=54955 RepID=UPI001CC76CDE|nr:uncharacterized protein LOC122638731 [Telopea speciosissima]
MPPQDGEASQHYRSDKKRSSLALWPYFNLMDRMELGPFPIAVILISTIDLHSIRVDDDEDYDDDDEINKSRSINHILRRPPMASLYPPQWNDGGGGGGGVAGSPGICRVLRNPVFRKRKSFEMDEVVEEEEGVDPISKFASVVRTFGKGFVRVENMKMEMIIKSQRRILDSIAKALGS